MFERNRHLNNFVTLLLANFSIMYHLDQPYLHTWDNIGERYHCWKSLL